MSGWKRLWIFLSVIWVAIVASIATFIVIEDTSENARYRLSAIYRLSEESKAFYQDLEKDEKGPAYTISFKYEDGTEQEIRLPLLGKELSELNNFGEQLTKLAEESGRTVNSRQIDQFIEKVGLKNSQAIRAKEEFDSEVEKAKVKNLEQRKKIIYGSLRILIIPPLIVLILGYGIAWVRRGFRKNA